MLPSRSTCHSPAAAALTGIAVKEGFCFGRQESFALSFRLQANNGDVLAEAAAQVAALLAHGGHIKAGFGLGDDTKRIVAKLAVEPAAVMELNAVFRARGYRKDMGIKGAVAVLFNRRFLKSKKAATSNWANPRLTEAQLVYAANDAWGAARVYHALGLD